VKKGCIPAWSGPLREDRPEISKIPLVVYRGSFALAVHITHTQFNVCTLVCVAAKGWSLEFTLAAMALAVSLAADEPLEIDAVTNPFAVSVILSRPRAAALDTTQHLCATRTRP
jgi:hypothetical protein